MLFLFHNRTYQLKKFGILILVLLIATSPSLSDFAFADPTDSFEPAPRPSFRVNFRPAPSGGLGVEQTVTINTTTPLPGSHIASTTEFILENLPPGMRIEIINQPDYGTLIDTILPGDVNRDGRVNHLDLNAVLASLGSRGSNLAADVDGSGAVTSGDLVYISNNWGKVSEYEPNTFIYEPSTLATSGGKDELRYRWVDSKGNAHAMSSIIYFQMNLPPDITAPIVSNVFQDQTTNTSARILLETDEKARAQIEYWITPESMFRTNLTELSQFHAISLIGLQPSTTYQFRVKSYDDAGNVSISEISNFTTASPLEAEIITVPFGKTEYDQFVLTKNHNLIGWGAGSVVVASRKTFEELDAFVMSEGYYEGETLINPIVINATIAGFDETQIPGYDFGDYRPGYSVGYSPAVSNVGDPTIYDGLVSRSSGGIYKNLHFFYFAGTGMVIEGGQNSESSDPVANYLSGISCSRVFRCLQFKNLNPNETAYFYLENFEAKEVRDESLLIDEGVVVDLKNFHSWSSTSGTAIIVNGKTHAQGVYPEHAAKGIELYGDGSYITGLESHHNTIATAEIYGKSNEIDGFIINTTSGGSGIAVGSGIGDSGEGAIVKNGKIYLLNDSVGMRIAADSVSAINISFTGYKQTQGRVAISIEKVINNAEIDIDCSYLDICLQFLEGGGLGVGNHIRLKHSGGDWPSNWISNFPANYHPSNQIYINDTLQIPPSATTSQVGTSADLKPIVLPSDFPGSVYGDVQSDSSHSVFGGSSAHFDGAGDYLILSNSEGINFGTGDFTIDFWARFDSTTGNQIFMDRNDGTQFAIQKSPTGDLQVTFGGANVIDRPWLPSVNTWYHLALTRSGTDLRMFINGVQVGNTVINSTNLSASSPVFIGAQSSGTSNFNGWIDEVRISKGVARWTSNFIPPVEEYTPDHATQLLLHFNPAVRDEEKLVGTLVINSGRISTNNPNVRLSILTQDNQSESNKLEMAFSQDGINFTEYESFSFTKQINLEATDGMKTVTVRIRDEAGNSRDFTDTIELNTTQNALLTTILPSLPTVINSTNGIAPQGTFYVPEYAIRYVDDYIIPRHADGTNHPAGQVVGYHESRSILSASLKTEHSIVSTEDWGLRISEAENGTYDSDTGLLDPTMRPAVLNPVVRDITIQGLYEDLDLNEHDYSGLQMQSAGGEINHVKVQNIPGTRTAEGDVIAAVLIRRNIDKRSGGTLPFDQSKIVVDDLKIYNSGNGFYAGGVDHNISNVFVHNVEGFAVHLDSAAALVHGMHTSGTGNIGIWISRGHSWLSGDISTSGQKIGLQIESDSNRTIVKGLTSRNHSEKNVLLNGGDNVISDFNLFVTGKIGFDIFGQRNLLEAGNIQITGESVGIKIGRHAEHTKISNTVIKGASGGNQIGVVIEKINEGDVLKNADLEFTFDSNLELGIDLTKTLGHANTIRITVPEADRDRLVKLPNIWSKTNRIYINNVLIEDRYAIDW